MTDALNWTTIFLYPKRTYNCNNGLTKTELKIAFLLRPPWRERMKFYNSIDGVHIRRSRCLINNNSNE